MRDGQGCSIRLRVFSQNEPVVIVCLQHQYLEIWQEGMLSGALRGTIVQHLQLRVTELEDGVWETMDCVFVRKPTREKEVRLVFHVSVDSKQSVVVSNWFNVVAKQSVEQQQATDSVDCYGVWY